MFVHFASANEVATRDIPRILRHGLAVAELAENDLPGVPSAVFAFKEVSPPRYRSPLPYFTFRVRNDWATKSLPLNLISLLFRPASTCCLPIQLNNRFIRACCSPVQRLTDDYDRYIVLSFTNATMVLEVSMIGVWVHSAAH